MALGIGLTLFVIVAIVALRLRRPRSLVQERDVLVTEPRAPETITPDEILAAADRIDLLDKRIDEEVRARMQLEECVLHANEELKVMRDRLHRASRRTEGDS